VQSVVMMVAWNDPNAPGFEQEPEDPSKVVMRLQPIVAADVWGALERTKATAHRFSDKYKRFAADFGSV
jgi:hypothetical protein